MNGHSFSTMVWTFNVHELKIRVSGIQKLSSRKLFKEIFEEFNAKNVNKTKLEFRKRMKHFLNDSRIKRL